MAIGDVSKSFLVLLSFLLFAFQNSCSTPGQRTVAPQNRIPLTRDAQQGGSWESNDAFLEYQYLKQSGVTKLSVRGRARKILEILVDFRGRVLISD